MQYHTILSIISLLAVAHGQEYDYGDCANSAGDAGSCINLVVCSAVGGTAEELLCPGPEEIQCCTSIPGEEEEGVGERCALDNGILGVCSLTTTCDGTSTPGICPGGENVQCCTPDAVGPDVGRPCNVRGAFGTCSLATKCLGTATPGFCPGGPIVQCCTYTVPPPE